MRGSLLAVGFASLALATSSVGCDHVAIVQVIDVRVFRDPDNGVSLDVDLRAAEQSGNSVGPYCVSAHVVPFGFDTNTPGLTAYRSQSDFTKLCAADLTDGDTRTFHLVLNRKDIAATNPIRVQTQRGKLVEDWMGAVAP